MLKLLGNPYALFGIGALILILGAGNVAFYALWDGAAKGEAAARVELASAVERGNANHDAVVARDGVIIRLTATLDDQSKAVQASRAKEAELRRSLDSVRVENDRLQVQADQISKEIDAEATATPGDVREVGPIVARRAKALFE